MGPQDPKDVTRDTARDLSALVGELAALKGDANHWLTGPEYATLRHRLENAHASAEAALVEARRRVRLNERQGELPHLALGCAMLHTSPRREEERWRINGNRLAGGAGMQRRFCGWGSAAFRSCLS